MQTELEHAKSFIEKIRPKLVERDLYRKALLKIVEIEKKKQQKSRAWHIAYHTLHDEEDIWA